MLINKKGFTLIELLVAITIVAILSLIALAVYTSMIKNAKDTKVKKDVDSIMKAYEQNYNSTTSEYKAFSSSWFRNGRPTHPNGGDYLICPSEEEESSIKVCGLLSDDQTIYCKRSSYGSAVNDPSVDGNGVLTCI